MRKNNLLNRIFFKEEIRKNMEDAVLKHTLSKNGARIINAINKCDSLEELLSIHKEAWIVGFQNENLGPDKYGMFRTENIPTMQPSEVFLGGIWGLFTHAIPFWEERKSQPYYNIDGRNNFNIVPKTRLYDIVLDQYKRLLISNFEDIWNKAEQLLVVYKKAGYVK